MHEAKEVDSFRVANVLEIDGRGGFQVGDAASFVTGRQYMVTRSIRTPDPGRDAAREFTPQSLQHAQHQLDRTFRPLLLRRALRTRL